MGLRLRTMITHSGGAAAVEMALALPLLFSLLLGAFEFGRLFWIWGTMQYAVEQTGRYAMARPSSTLPQLEAYLRQNFPGLNASTIQVQLTNETVSGVDYVVVVAKYQFSFISLFPIPAVNLEGRSRVPVVI